MICPNCGQPIDQGASFCGNCGQSLVTVNTGGQPAQSPTINPMPPTTLAPPTPQPPAPSPIAPPQPGLIAPAPSAPINSVPTAPSPVTGYPPQQPAMAPVTGVMATPAYAMPQQNLPASKGETKAVIGLLAAVLGIPGSLIPIAGLILGITGVVIGSTSRHIKRGIATTSIIVGILAILLSLAAWTYNVLHSPRFKKGSLSSNLQQINTPCYSAKLSTSLHIDNAEGSCKATAMDGTTLESSTNVLSINSVNDPTLNAANFDSWAKAAAPTIVQAASSADRTYKLSSEKATTFAGKEAHTIIADSDQHTQVELITVLYNAPNGDNIFVISNAVSGSTASLTELEKSFVWK